MDELIFREMETDHLVKNRWIDLRQVYYTMPNGQKSAPYYTYSRKNYCVIVATDPDGNYICVHQFRPGLGRVTCEFCAGGIERSGDTQYGPDSSEQEEPLRAAMRELREETGYASVEWELLMVVPSNATMADNFAYIFRAKNCFRGEKFQHLDDGEFLRVELVSPEDLSLRVREGCFEQAIHILAWMLAKQDPFR